MKKIAIITGASGGIGIDLCLRYIEKGYQVIALDKNEHVEMPNAVDFYRVDLKSEAEILHFFETIKRTYKTAHVLINNAAISSFHKRIEDISSLELNDVLAVNLRAPMLMAKAFISLNRGESYGRIINIASTRWHQNEPDWEAYGATKGGIVSFTNSLCVSLSHTPITVNAISPGWIHTNSIENLSENDHKQHPSGRVGKPSDISSACLFLCEPENDFINGANLIIDGGMTKKMIYD